MAELKVSSRLWTLANNRELEGFVEERLDRFCASLDWLLNFPRALILHEHKQSSDNSLFVLDTHPDQQRAKKRFYYDHRILEDEATLAAIALKLGISPKRDIQCFKSMPESRITEQFCSKGRVRRFRTQQKSSKVLKRKWLQQ